MNKKHNLPSALEVGQAEYQRLYYRDIGGSAARERRQKKNEARRRFVNFLKEGQTCLDCGLKWPSYVLDFDHRPDVDKKFRISRWVSSSDSVDVLQDEIMKCDLVCSNCHRIRTQNRLRSL